MLLNVNYQLNEDGNLMMAKWFLIHSSFIRKIVFLSILKFALAIN